FEATREQVHAAVAAARNAVDKMPVLQPIERANVLRKAADLLEARRDEIANLMVAETGFTPDDVIGDISRTLITLMLSAEEATRIVGETVSFAATPGQHARLGFTIRVPLGVICAI